MTALFSSLEASRLRLLDRIRQVQAVSIVQEQQLPKIDEEEAKPVEEISFSKMLQIKKEKALKEQEQAEMKALEKEEEIAPFDDDTELLITGRRHGKGLVMLEEQDRFESEIFGDPQLSHPKSREMPRNPELEGLYVAPKPEIPDWNYQLLISRALRQDPEQVKLFQDKLLTVNSLPTYPGNFPRHPVASTKMLENIQDNFETIVKKPIPAQRLQQHYDFTIQFGTLKFTDFPLLSKEDLLCHEIEEAYNEYQRRVGINLVKYYSTRLDVLKTLLKNQLTQFDSLVDSESQLAMIKKIILTIENLLKMREERDIEEIELLRLISTMYKTWTKVKKWREAEGQRLELTHKGEDGVLKSKQYVGNSLRLVLEVNQPDFTEEKQLYDRSILEEVDERELIAQMKRKLLILTKDQVALDLFEIPDKKSLHQNISGRRFSCRQPGARIIVPIVDKKAILTDPLDLSSAEKSRRETILSSKLRLKLYIDGNELDFTPYYNLTTYFTLSVEHTFKMRLVRIPTEVKVEILQDGFFGDYCIGTMYLPIPSVQAAPSAEKAHFAGGRIILSDRQALAMEMHDDSYNEIGKDEKEKRDREAIQNEAKLAVHSSRFIRGELEFLMSWDCESDDGPAQKGVEVYSKKSEATNRISDIVRNMKEELDPNDPRNLSLLEFQRRLKLLEVHGKSFRCVTLPKELNLCNPESANVLGGRITILKLRTKVDLLRKESVPISDDDIPTYLYAAIADAERCKVDPEFAASYAAKQALHRPRKIHSVSEVVNESSAPNFHFDLSSLQECLYPSRKLRTKPIVREPAANPSSCRVVIQVVRAANLPCRAVFNKRKKKRAEEHEIVDCAPQVEIQFQNRSLSTAVSKGPNPHWNQTLVFEFNPPNNQFIPSVIRSVKDEIYFNIFDVVTTVESSAENKSKKVSSNERRWLGSLSIPFTTIYTNSCKVEGFFRLDTPVLNLAYIAPASTGSYMWIFATLDPPLVPFPSPHADSSLMENHLFRVCQNWLDNIKSEPQCMSKYIRCFAEDENQDTYVLTQYMYPIAPPDSKEGTFIRFVSQIPVKDQQSYSGFNLWCTVPSFINIGHGDSEEHAILLANYFLYEDIKALENPRQSESIFDTFVVLGTAIPDGDSVYVLRREISYGRIKDVWLYNACSGLKYRYDDHRCPLRDIGCVFNMENIWGNIQTADIPNLSYDFNNSTCWSPMLPRNLQPDFLHSVMSSDVQKSTIIARNLNRTRAKEPNLNRRGSVVDTVNEADRLVEQDLDTGEMLSVVEEEQIPWWRFCLMACQPGNYQLTKERVQDRLRSINSSPLYYRETSGDICTAREGFIRQAIQTQFELHRSGMTTRWEYAVSDVLRGLLADRFEFMKQGHEERDLDPETYPGLKKLREIYRDMYGVPLNFQDNLSSDLRYQEKNDENPIVRAVLNTGIHLVDSPNARFALSVYIFPYYNNIASVWVYIASLNTSK